MYLSVLRERQGTCFSGCQLGLAGCPMTCLLLGRRWQQHSTELNWKSSQVVAAARSFGVLSYMLRKLAEGRCGQLDQEIRYVLSKRKWEGGDSCQVPG